VTAPADGPAPVPWAALDQFARACARAVGLLEADVDFLANALIKADLRGVGSHGCSRLPAYARAVQQSIINPRPTLRVVHSWGATEVIDGDNSLGTITGQVSMIRATELAETSGVGVVSVRNCNHTGMLAAHVTHASDRSMIGFFVSNTPAIMAPWGGREPRLGNGPMAYAIPRMPGLPPIILDMATSATNRGRIREHAESGRAIPSSWAIDQNGASTTDATAALLGSVLPFGGHKGYGLAFINEILSGVLAGAALGVEMPREFLRESSTTMDSWRSGHTALAINLAAFGDPDGFFERLEQLVAAVKTSRLSDGSSEILLPGEIEARTSTERLKSGIPLGPGTRRRLRELATELRVSAI
jgi:LDH2 family malate/lactate/ureidoglycolate dehydrogenase